MSVILSDGIAVRIFLWGSDKLQEHPMSYYPKFTVFRRLPHLLCSEIHFFRTMQTALSSLLRTRDLACKSHFYNEFCLAKTGHGVLE